MRFYLGLLKEDAGRCSIATNAILQGHVRFASLMAQRVDDASRSQYNLKYDYSETTRLANDISEASRSLSIHVTKMKDNLDKFVAALEKVQVTMKKERSLVERIMGWLKSLFRAIARIFAKYCPPVSAVLHSAVSTLGKAAATFCAADSGVFLEHIILSCRDSSDWLFDAEPQEGKEAETLDSVILFLKEIVPGEAQTAHEKLERFGPLYYGTGASDEGGSTGDPIRSRPSSGC